MTIAHALSNAIKKHPAQGARLAFFFNGVEGPRYLGHAETPRECDSLLIRNRLSAEKISRAQIKNTGQHFYIAHS